MMMTWNRAAWLVAGLLCMAVIDGCGRGGQSGKKPVIASVSDSSDRSSWVQKRPAAKVDSIRVEGAMQRVELQLFDQGLSFSTYIPEKEIRAQTLTARDGRTARFVASFAGKTNPDVYLDIFIPSSPLSLADIKHSLLDQNGLVQQRGWKMESGRFPTGDICPWADESYFFIHQTASGRASVNLCVGRHKDRAFYAIVQMPDEYTEGFTPRVDLILRELRWLDDGTKLRQE